MGNLIQKEYKQQINLIQKEYKQINLSSFIYVFNEYIRYTRSNMTSNTFRELNERLHKLGYDIGFRLGEIEMYNYISENKINIDDDEADFLIVLKYIAYTLWPKIFDSQPVSLEKTNDNKYLICQTEFIVNRFSTMDCGEFVAGVVDGFLTGKCFKIKKVFSHISDDKRNIIVIEPIF